jgi:hypothetical protein
MMDRQFCNYVKPVSFSKSSWVNEVRSFI